MTMRMSSTITGSGMPESLAFRPLVKGNHVSADAAETDGVDTQRTHEVLASDVSLSFWGGIDPITGIIIDQLHPLAGECVSGKIFCLPSGRGSCTASQVLLELIVNGKAPRAIVLRDRDGLVCVGAIVAQAVFPDSSIPDILQVEDFDSLMQQVKQSEDDNVDSHGYVSVPEGRLTITAGSGVDAGTIAGAVTTGEGEAGGGSHTQHEKQTQVETQAQLPHDSESDQQPSAPQILDGIELSEEEQGMLREASNVGELRATQCLIRYAHIVSDKPTYTDATQAHIDGCTYIGPAGLEFVKRFVAEGCKVKIPTTLNSVSTDLRNWKSFGIAATESQLNAIRLADAYVALGCSGRSFTCAPYLLDSAPQQNDQIAWGESNAVVYANSVLGARTEKYADYLDICCAIVGKAPMVGVHHDANRRPKVILDASGIDFGRNAGATKIGNNEDNSTLNDETFSLLFPVLGHLCGSLSDGHVPILIGMEDYKDRINEDHLKAFCAAFGTTGTSPLIHIAGITPETKDAKALQSMLDGCDITREVTADDLDRTFDMLDQKNRSNNDDADRDQDDANTDAHKETIEWIALGNPHLSLSECDELLKILERKEQTRHPNVRMIACMARELLEQSDSAKTLRTKFGVEFVNDTCWCMLLQTPMIPASEDSTILTNSGKYAHYGPGLVQRRFRLGSLQDCVDAAMAGYLPRRGKDSMPWRIQSRGYHLWCGKPRSAAGPFISSFHQSSRVTNHPNANASMIVRSLIRRAWK